MRVYKCITSQGVHICTFEHGCPTDLKLRPEDYMKYDRESHIHNDSHRIFYYKDDKVVGQYVEKALEGVLIRRLEVYE